LPQNPRLSWNIVENDVWRDGPNAGKAIDAPSP
jgi:hypothetical protein